MAKKCFVIMPYGGDDEEARRHYDGVFLGIIEPAVTKAGYEVKRSDIGGAPGNITHDIIQDLANSDAVIADLTGANANVLFELGIRHVLRKSGTVHIVDKAHTIPFDIRQYRAVQYSTDLADAPVAIAAISTAIRKRDDDPTHSDNPVHDALPGLPLDLRSTGDEAVRARMAELQSRLEEMSDVEQSLRKRLEEIDPQWSGGPSEGVDVDAVLDDANTRWKSSGQHVLLRLRTAMESNGAEGFIRELREVLRSPYLDSNDYAEIARLCRQQGLLDHRRATLEIATRRFPGELTLKLALVDSYDDGADPDLKERGRVVLEELLGIEHQNGVPKLTGKPKMPVAQITPALAVLFNLYNHLGRWDWVVPVAETAEPVTGFTALLGRNRARGLAEVGLTDEAEREFRRTLEAFSNDDSTHSFYGDFLDDQRRIEEAYCEFEEAVLCDPRDGSRYSNLAIHILNRSLVRDEEGNFAVVSEGDAIKAAVPLFVQAMRDRDREMTMRGRVVGILVRRGALSEARAFAEGTEPTGTYDQAPLKCLLARLPVAL
ncbi:MAG: hypothetical protein ABFE08_03585 [Armatimonadia bacterium]